MSKIYVKNPLLRISDAAAQMMVKCASEFGLTPAARASLGVDPGAVKKGKFNGLIPYK